MSSPEDKVEAALEYASSVLQHVHSGSSGGAAGGGGAPADCAEAAVTETHAASSGADAAASGEPAAVEHADAPASESDQVVAPPAAAPGDAEGGGVCLRAGG